MSFGVKKLSVELMKLTVVLFELLMVRPYLTGFVRDFKNEIPLSVTFIQKTLDVRREENDILLT